MESSIEYPVTMLMRMILVCLFLGWGIMQPLTASAQVPDMTMNATPNPVGSGARAMGMGGAFISVADDATAASWNPGGLLQLTKPEISAVGSFFSGSIDYKTSGINGDIEDTSPDIYHLNYLSAVLPFTMLQRNFVFSLNYQHLYEFSLENRFTWMEVNSIAMIDLSHNDYKYQKGSLNTLSPALGIQINPSLFMGVTLNIWEDDILDNGWENINIQAAQGIDLGYEKRMHSEIYERYDFSGFNMHLGFLFTSDYHTLWGGKRKFRIGGVVKTPFDADIRHEKQEIFYEDYPGNPVLNNYYESTSSQELTIKMPLSYGLGVSLYFTDSFCMALDVYRTHWEQYLLVYPSGVERSPINKEFKDQADIDPTTQIRLGGEYLFQKPGRIIPVRLGAFYDPEPATGRPDDIYGISIGTGISYREIFSIDFVYQYRFGDKKEAESMHGADIVGEVKQHYFYTSIIYYLF
ncbi:MAG: OmpP1/FadL family transporter [bacterium]